MENWNEIQVNAYGGWLNNPERREDSRLVILPVTIRTARAFVAWTHRYLVPPAGAAFALGVQTGDGTLVGVALIGWPTTLAFDDGDTAEVLALATDGTPGTCSALLAAAWLAVHERGYRCLIAYTRIDEPGTELWEAGFRIVPRPLGWNAVSRTALTGVGDAVRALWEITERNAAVLGSRGSVGREGKRW